MEQLGKYKILGKIGHGAMGEVYKGHDPVLNRLVAIKTVAPSLTSDDQFKKRFLREAQSAAALSHRNIVTVFEFGEEEGLTYLVMELLEGTDLKELIARRAVARIEDRLSIVEQICDGLAYAHEKGVVHRDLKPANVHVLPNRAVKIMDFGLARLGTSDMTRTGTVMGTPNYMSPEQVRGEKADARSDVFSVGAVTYELLAGKKPFDADTMHTVLFQVLEQEPEPIRRWIPEMPLPVVRVIDTALAKDPSRRFQSAGEMRGALRAARRAIAASRAAAAALGAPEAEATLGGLEGPTIIGTVPASAPHLGSVTGERRTLVTGATALDPTRIEMPDLPRTARPDETFRGVEESPARSPLLWVGVGTVVVAVAVSGGLLLRSRSATPPTMAPGEMAREQEGILKETLIAGQIELARTELANKDYGKALVQARAVLELDPANAEAQELRQRAQATLDDLEASAGRARDAFARGDTKAATAALARVLAIDPRHPVAGELTTALNQHFRGQAEEARARAGRARREAERAQGRPQPEFGQSERLVAAAEGRLGKGQYAEATQRFLEAGDGFARAQRAAEIAAAAAAAEAARAARVRQAAAAAKPSVPPTATPSATTAPTLAASATPSLAPSTQAQAPLPPPSLASPTSAPSLPVPSGPDPAVRQVIADYGRAIETRDVALFKTIKPDLSGDEEKRLEDAFKAIQSHLVGIAVDSVKIEGTKATVRVSRRDTINGKEMKPQQQVFRLVQKSGAWTIQSIGQ